QIARERARDEEREIARRSDDREMTLGLKKDGQPGVHCVVAALSACAEERRERGRLDEARAEDLPHRAHLRSLASCRRGQWRFLDETADEEHIQRRHEAEREHPTPGLLFREKRI